MKVQTGGLGIYPARIEAEVAAGQEKTVAFQIESPVSDQTIQGRLNLSFPDWTINEDATTVYSDSGTLPDSASKWVIFSLSAIHILSGEAHQVRVTVRVPEATPAGVYRTAIFVQERPPAAPPKPGQHLVYLRFRYTFTLYVPVGPVEGKKELVNASLNAMEKAYRLTCEMKNWGSRHLRAQITWSLRDWNQKEVFSV